MMNVWPSYWGRILLGLAFVAGSDCRATPTSPAPRSLARSTNSPANHPSPPPTASPTSGWSVLAEHEGIVVSSKPSVSSPIPIFRGVGMVDAPLLDVLAVVTDADRHHEWIFACSDSKVIESIDTPTSIVYNRTATPWPVPDRDVVLISQAQIIDGARQIVVRFSATEHPQRPPASGVVRITYLQGHYHLWAQDDDHTRVEYQVDSDPGGHLPPWLATQGTRDIPLKSLQGLRQQVVRTRGSYAEQIAEFRRILHMRER